MSGLIVREGRVDQSVAIEDSPMKAGGAGNATFGQPGNSLDSRNDCRYLRSAANCSAVSVVPSPINFSS
ncbi:hypothetical protein UA18_01712 [Burkholderia multivorans]|uniref:Uncharacterized protein n=1 Tax=Burkholderia multivorans TaxID=87883 RepID=A0ABD7LHN2_9BURK|nr:hypothetical protein UA18_01712 [Burkholderia multivorans]SAK19861.1 hypothetical protein UA17_01913 [Burkholderia multivorans]